MEFLKNFVPLFFICLACIGGVIGMIFVFLAAMPPEMNTMSPTEVAVGAGGWMALWHSLPLIFLISALTAAWVAAMKPFTSKRMAMDSNGDIVFLDPLIK